MTSTRTLAATPLTPAQREEIAALLRRRQQELLDAQTEQQQGGSRADHAREVLEQDGDDAPQRDADREVELARVDSAAVELAALGTALARVDGPAFGLCVDCDAAIPFARLIVEPGAARCVACEALHEGPTGHRTL